MQRQPSYWRHLEEEEEEDRSYLYFVPQSLLDQEKEEEVPNHQRQTFVLQLVVCSRKMLQVQQQKPQSLQNFQTIVRTSTPASVKLDLLMIEQLPQSLQSLEQWHCLPSLDS